MSWPAVGYGDFAPFPGVFFFASCTIVPIYYKHENGMQREKHAERK